MSKSRKVEIQYKEGGLRGRTLNTKTSSPPPPKNSSPGSPEKNKSSNQKKS